MRALNRILLSGLMALALTLPATSVGATVTASWMPSIVNVMNLVYCIVGIGPCPNVFDPDSCWDGDVVSHIDGMWTCGAPDELGLVGPQGAAGAQGLMGPQGEPGPAGEQGPGGLPGAAGPEGPAGAQGPAGTPADEAALQAEISALQGQVTTLQGQVAALEAQGGGGLSQMTQYPVNSACVESHYGDAIWTWAQVFPAAVANGEQLSQCIMIGKDQAAFTWSYDMVCTGSGTTYNLFMNDMGPGTSWNDQAASTNGYIGGVAAASFIVSGRTLVCFQ